MSDSPDPIRAKGDLTEVRVRGEWVYRGRLLQVRRDVVRLPGGAQAEREYIEHPGAVMVVPLRDNGTLVMERQYRYPVRREMIELPAGKIDPGEAPLESAKRELLEETGYRAEEWRHVATTHSVVGYSDERIEIFIARGLTQHGASLDDGENVEVFELALPTALDWVRDGRITDAKTMIGLFWADRALRGEWA